MDLEILDHETGELFQVTEQLNTKRLKEMPKVSKLLVDKMLDEAKELKDIDMDLLYQWLKISKSFNKYNQVKILGVYIASDYLKLRKEDALMTGYSVGLIEIMHPFTNILMKNHKTWIRTWAELYVELGITAKNTQTKFKKFCTDNDLIRVCKTQHYKDRSDITTKMIVNPFILRKANHVGQLAIANFGDLVKEGVNMDTYSVKFLEYSGVLDMDRKTLY